jgi:hypothetical protein
MGYVYSNINNYNCSNNYITERLRLLAYKIVLDSSQTIKKPPKRPKLEKERTTNNKRGHREIG